MDPATLLAWSSRTGITYGMLVTPPEDQLDALVSARGYIAHLLLFAVQWYSGARVKSRRPLLTPVEAHMSYGVLSSGIPR